jgi:hypothetical protein
MRSKRGSSAVQREEGREIVGTASLRPLLVPPSPQRLPTLHRAPCGPCFQGEIVSASRWGAQPCAQRGSVREAQVPSRRCARCRTSPRPPSSPERRRVVLARVRRMRGVRSTGSAAVCKTYGDTTSPRACSLLGFADSGDSPSAVTSPSMRVMSFQKTLSSTARRAYHRDRRETGS